MRRLLILTLCLFVIGCAGKQYNPDVFDATFRYAAGIKGKVAEVGVPYRINVFYSGVFPIGPVCIERFIDGEPIGMSCGHLTDPNARITVIFTLSDYILRNPPPRGRLLGIGERDEVLPYLGADASQDTTPSVKIGLRVYEAAADIHGVLCPLKKVLLYKQTRPITLQCKHCTW